MPPSGFLSLSVLDTNVWVGNFLSRSPKIFNRRIVRLWLIERRLKLAISNEIEAEYLRIFQEVLQFDNQQIAVWRKRFNNRQTVKRVRLKVKTPISRDPKDDIFIHTALISKSDFLVTNDFDLLEISETEKQKLKFQTVTPQTFLEQLEKIS